MSYPVPPANVSLPNWPIIQVSPPLPLSRSLPLPPCKVLSPMPADQGVVAVQALNLHLPLELAGVELSLPVEPYSAVASILSTATDDGPWLPVH